MEKILILGCQQAMNSTCIACSRCLVGFNRRAGAFEAYKDQDAELIALLDCGGCPGATVVTRLAQVKLWNAPMDEKPTKVHVAPCIAMHCPHKDAILKKVYAKAGCDVVEGAHPYMPDNIFA
jgi:predicted metal-binding protein